MERPLYQELARTIDALKRCKAPAKHGTDYSANMADWIKQHTTKINELVGAHLPSGSGFDTGTKIDMDESHADKLVFYVQFHHMDENGFYDGWTEHTVTVKPSLAHGLNIRISGANRNDIKDTIHEEFNHALRVDVTYDLYVPSFPQFKVTSKWEDKEGNPSQCYQAFYVDGKRFWNNFEGARILAGQLAYAEFMKPRS